MYLYKQLRQLLARLGKYIEGHWKIYIILYYKLQQQAITDKQFIVFSNIDLKVTTRTQFVYILQIDSLTNVLEQVMKLKGVPDRSRVCSQGRCTCRRLLTITTWTWIGIEPTFWVLQVFRAGMMEMMRLLGGIWRNRVWILWGMNKNEC